MNLALVVTKVNGFYFGIWIYRIDTLKNNVERSKKLSNLRKPFIGGPCGWIQ
jgi:hypothetical protein